MKKYISIFIIVFTALTVRVSAQDTVSLPVQQTEPVLSIPEAATPEAKWEAANNYYQKGEYTSAILLYEDLLGSNTHSDKLYYNLGNAYFKSNTLGKAILNYNRAVLLNPGDEDILHNLTLASARTIDKIEPVPQFFIKEWIIALGDMFSPDGWVVAALMFLSLTLAGVVIWLITSALNLRKIGFYTALVSAIFTICSFAYAQSGYNKLTNSTDAIIMNTAAPVKSAPDGTSKDLFLLHEGTRVAIIDEVQGWSEIRLEDGNKGWIQSNAVERIVLQ